MAEADRTTPQTIRRKAKKKRVTRAPSTTDRTSPNPTPPPKPKKGPPSPQRTGKATRPQPVARKRAAAPTTTDRTSDAKRSPAQKAHDREVVDRVVREARRKVVRKHGRGAYVKALKREAEGHGLLAKAGDAAGKFLEGSVRLTSTGAGPTAAVNLGASGGRSLKAPRGAATVMAPKAVKIKGTVAGRIVKDLANLPAQALPSVYVPAAGVVEAAKGDPSRIKKFAKDFKETDPVYNTVAAGVEAAKGNTGSAKSHLRKAKKSVEEHPGFAAVEAYGVKGAVGRGAGATMRSGAVGSRAKRVASTERPDRVVPGTNIREQRTYSKDVLTKAGQKAVERSRRRHAAKLRKRADAAEPGSDRAVELRDRAARVDPDRLPESEIKRRVDERVAVNEDVRRAHRGQVVSRAREVVQEADRGGAATSVVAQRIARADKTDLKAYVRELEGQFDGLSNSGKRANKTLRRELQRVIDDPKADMGKVESAARSYEKLIAPLEKKLVKRGLLGEGQEAKAKLIPYAVRNMGARHESEKRAPTEMVERHELAKGIAKGERQAASAARRELGKTKTIARRARDVEQRDAPKSSVRVRQTGIKAPFEIRLPRRPLTDKERAAVDERLAEFKATAKAAVETQRKRTREQEQVAAKADALAKKAKPKKYVPGIVGPDGEPLSVEAIEAHMKRHGVEEPAFITQAPNQRGGRNFNVRSERPVAIQNGRRTGEATRKGTFDANPETLVEGAAKAQGLVDATDGFRASIKEFAARKPNGKVRTHKGSYRDALQVANDLVHDANGDPIPGAVKLKPVLLNPQGAKNLQLENLLDDVNHLDTGEQTALLGAMTDALKAKSGNGKWAFIPEAAADQLLDHLNTQGGAGGIKTLQLANQAFRRTVLSTSPAKVTGDIVEGVGRAAIAGAGPRSFVTGKRLLAELERIDPKAAEEALSRLVPGGHYGMASKLHVRTGSEKFQHTKMAPVANALGKFWRTPGPKQAAEWWHRYTEFVLRGISGAVESQIQTAMLGKAVRSSELMSAKTLKLSEAAIADAAKGLKSTEAQVRFGREVDRMYGRYSKFKPGERRLISTYTPFIAWWLNSVYFVTRTLPRDHPVVTALTAAAVNATEDWRKDEGLDLFLEKGKLPGFLQGSIPTGGGAHQRVSRFGPFGAFTSPTETLAGQVLPIASGPLAALTGEDWTGKKIYVVGSDGKKREANDLEKAQAATQSFIESTIPFLSTGKRVAEQGPRALDPFRDTKAADKPKKKLKIAKPGAGTGRRSSGGSSSGGGFFGGSSSSGGSSGSSDSGSFF